MVFFIDGLSGNIDRLYVIKELGIFIANLKC